MTASVVCTLERFLTLDAHSCRLSYRLFAHPSSVSASRTAYGFEITLTDCVSGSEESCRIADVTTRQNCARQYLDLIANGLVTPLTARDVVEDLLADDRLSSAL